MYEKFSQNLTDAIQVLKEADEVITKLLGAVELNPIRIRVVTDLNRIANSIAINTGRPVDVGVAGAGTEVGRVSRFMGKEISKSPVSVTDEVVLKNIPNTAAAELSIRVKDIYPQFTELENDEIRDSLADAEIRGVAKKAGLPVTETTPAKIDSKFIDQIKDAIAAKAKQKELERQGKSGASKENEPTTETALGDDSSKDVTHRSHAKNCSRFNQFT